MYLCFSSGWSNLFVILVLNKCLFELFETGNVFQLVHLFGCVLVFCVSSVGKCLCVFQHVLCVSCAGWPRSSGRYEDKQKLNGTVSKSQSPRLLGFSVKKYFGKIQFLEYKIMIMMIRNHNASLQ